MAAICQRCALQLQRAAQVDTQHLSKRAFSTSRRQCSLPTFAESSSPQLNDALTTLRSQHFIPAYLKANQQKLVFKQKYKQQLEDNPVTVKVGDEDIQLKWIDRHKDIPARDDLVGTALKLILNQKSEDWQNIPLLLQGLKEGVKRPLKEPNMEKIVRKSFQAGKFGIVLQCIQQAERTGMSLKSRGILKNVIIGLREMAQKDGWSKAGTSEALRYANAVSLLLESDAHGSGNVLAEDDPRTRPEILGLFLELAAVYAYKHVDGKDESGLVKAYAGRLMSCLEQRGAAPEDLDALSTDHQNWRMLRRIPVWHGLSVAEKVLGEDMPNRPLAQLTIAEHEKVLSQLATALEAENPKPDTYNNRSLKAWKECIRV